MARSRNIKPGFFGNEYLAELNPMARLLFAGLWCLADREGRLEDRPKRIKAETLAYDDCDVDKMLDDLMNAEEQFIVRYEVEGNKYIQISNFKKHQNPHKSEKLSVIPPITEQAQYKYRTSTVQERVYNVSNPADSLNLIPDSLILIPSSLIADSSEKDAAAADGEKVDKESLGTRSIKFAESNFGRPITEHECQELIAWCNDFSEKGSEDPDAVVVAGLQRCVEENVRKLSYLKPIMIDWLDNGITSLEHIANKDAEWKAKKDKGKGPKVTVTKPPGDKYESFYL